MVFVPSERWSKFKSGAYFMRWRRQSLKMITHTLSSGMVLCGLLCCSQIMAAELGTSADAADSSAQETDKKPISAEQEKLNEQTSNAVNQIPGVHIRASDLQPPADEVQIKGFHPIKKMLQPVVRLEKNSTQLQQQIMKLEGPIAGLQQPMLGLHSKMTSVEGKMNSMHDQLSNMQSELTGVRSDISGMRKQIGDLRGPINALQEPISALQKPLTGVATPLEAVQTELKQVRALIATVLFAIVAAAIAISIGTPLAAIFIYKHRRKVLPGVADRDFPVAKSADQMANTIG